MRAVRREGGVLFSEDDNFVNQVALELCDVVPVRDVSMELFHNHLILDQRRAGRSGLWAALNHSIDNVRPQLENIHRRYIGRPRFADARCHRFQVGDALGE